MPPVPPAPVVRPAGAGRARSPTAGAGVPPCPRCSRRRSRRCSRRRSRRCARPAAGPRCTARPSGHHAAASANRPTVFPPIPVPPRSRPSRRCPPCLRRRPCPPSLGCCRTCTHRSRRHLMRRPARPASRSCRCTRPTHPARKRGPTCRRSRLLLRRHSPPRPPREIAPLQSLVLPFVAPPTLVPGPPQDEDAGQCPTAAAAASTSWDRNASHGGLSPTFRLARR